MLEMDSIQQKLNQMQRNDMFNTAIAISKSKNKENAANIAQSLPSALNFNFIKTLLLIPRFPYMII